MPGAFGRMRIGMAAASTTSTNWPAMRWPNSVPASTLHIAAGETLPAIVRVSSTSQPMIARAPNDALARTRRASTRA